MWTLWAGPAEGTALATAAGPAQARVAQAHVPQERGHADRLSSPSDGFPVTSKWGRLVGAEEGRGVKGLGALCVASGAPRGASPGQEVSQDQPTPASSAGSCSAGQSQLSRRRPQDPELGRGFPRRGRREGGPREGRGQRGPQLPPSRAPHPEWPAYPGLAIHGGHRAETPLPRPHLGHPNTARGRSFG